MSYGSFDGNRVGIVFGSVSSVEDPLRLGRCQIRFDGDTYDKKQIPDDKLPWNQVATGTGGPSLAGAGVTHGLEPGSRVMALKLSNDNDGSTSYIVLSSLFPGESSFTSYPPPAKGTEKKGPPKIPSYKGYGAMGNKFINDKVTNGNLQKIYSELYSKLKQFIGLIPRG